jgi:uncharacterized protein (DUF58 family)
MPVTRFEHRSLREDFNPALLSALGSFGLKAQYVVEGFLSGIHRSPFYGFSSEFSDYRDYQIGDDLRHLDWKLFARSDRLSIRRYTHETNLRLYLVCDTSASMAYRGSNAWASKMEASRLLAAAISWLVLRQNDGVGAISLDEADSTPDFVRPSQGRSQFGLMLAHFQRLEPRGTECMAQLLDHAKRLIARRSMLVLISDFLEPAENLELPLKQLRHQGHECLLLQVLDPDELDFPFGGSHRFVDPETGEERTTVGESARATYLERFGAFMRRQKSVFDAMELSHVLMRTDENPWNVLSSFLMEREKHR